MRTGQLSNGEWLMCHVYALLLFVGVVLFSPILVAGYIMECMDLDPWNWRKK